MWLGPDMWPGPEMWPEMWRRLTADGGEAELGEHGAEGGRGRADAHGHDGAHGGAGHQRVVERRGVQVHRALLRSHSQVGRGVAGARGGTGAGQGGAAAGRGARWTPAQRSKGAPGGRRALAALHGARRTFFFSAGLPEGGVAEPGTTGGGGAGQVSTPFCSTSAPLRHTRARAPAWWRRAPACASRPARHADNSRAEG